MAAIALLLGDARFPSGGHAHSGGIEEACDRGLIGDTAGLGDFLRGRLLSTGTVSAQIAAFVCTRIRAGTDPEWLWPAVDAACDARLVSPAARAVSRQQGSQLARSAASVFEAAHLRSLRSLCEPHHPVAVGAVSAAAGLDPRAAAETAAYGSLAGGASAGLRLLGLDPTATARVVAGLAPLVDAIAARAALAGRGPLARLDSTSAPVSDLLAEAHFERKERLFAS